MSDIPQRPKADTPSVAAGKYFKVQIRGWTDFDPIDKTLPEIADAIERGGGFLTAVEVLDAKDDLASITDNAVREGFQAIMAARRVLRSLGELPGPLVEELRAALNSHSDVRKKSTASQATEPPIRRAS